MNSEGFGFGTFSKSVPYGANSVVIRVTQDNTFALFLRLTDGRVFGVIKQMKVEGIEGQLWYDFESTRPPFVTVFFFIL